MRKCRSEYVALSMAGSTGDLGHGLASCPEDTHWQLIAGDTQTISRIA